MADRTPDLERMLFLRREAEKIVRELFELGEGGGGPAQGGVDGPGSALKLLADLRAEGEDYSWEVDVPGVRPADLKVHVVGDSVVVEGRKEMRTLGPERPTFERAERVYGGFRRVFGWPGPADLSRLAARLRAGVLTLSVPRIVDRRGKRPRAVRVFVERDP
jgi:HSP20 family protein